MCAVTLRVPSIATPCSVRVGARVLVLGCGPDSVRFRPALTVTRSEIDRALAALREVLPAAV